MKLAFGRIMFKETCLKPLTDLPVPYLELRVQDKKRQLGGWFQIYRELEDQGFVI